MSTKKTSGGFGFGSIVFMIIIYNVFLSDDENTTEVTIVENDQPVVEETIDESLKTIKKDTRVIIEDAKKLFNQVTDRVVEDAKELQLRIEDEDVKRMA